MRRRLIEALRLQEQKQKSKQGQGREAAGTTSVVLAGLNTRLPLLALTDRPHVVQTDARDKRGPPSFDPSDSPAKAVRIEPAEYAVIFKHNSLAPTFRFDNKEGNHLE